MRITQQKTNKQHGGESPYNRKQKMKKSENICDLAFALAKAQSEMQNPQFDSKNPHFKSSYASLASVRNAVVPVLARNGLSLLQDVTTTESGVTCSNLLMHESGQWIETQGITVFVDKQNAHGIGSATTYARRFSLMALVTVVGDDDDDGNAAAAPQKVEVNLDLLTAIKEAADMDALATIWKKCPPEQQKLLTEAKDKRKKELSKPVEQESAQ